MTTTSGPIVGVNIDAPLWRKMNSNTDGIINDFVGNAFSLSTTGDIATITGGLFRFDGFVMTVTGTETFTFPAVAGTYVIAAVYNPANESADPAGPLKLVGGLKGSIATPSGGALVTFYEVVRTSAPMSSMTVWADLRRWTGDTQLVRVPNARPALARGSVLTESVQGRPVKVLVRDMVGPALGWVDPSDPPWNTFDWGPDTAVRPGYDCQYRLNGGMIQMRGVLQRKSYPATMNDGYRFGYLPAGWRPSRKRWYVGYYGTTGTTYTLTLDTDGALELQEPTRSVAVVILDGFSVSL